MNHQTYKALRKIEKSNYMIPSELFSFLGCTPDSYIKTPLYESVIDFLELRYINNDENDSSQAYFLTSHAKHELIKYRSIFWHNFRMELFAALTAFSTVGTLIASIFLS